VRRFVLAPICLCDDLSLRRIDVAPKRRAPIYPRRNDVIPRETLAAHIFDKIKIPTQDDTTSDSRFLYSRVSRISGHQNLLAEYGQRSRYVLLINCFINGGTN
jgi:hypothetical protein